MRGYARPTWDLIADLAEECFSAGILGNFVISDTRATVPDLDLVSR